MIKPKGLDSVTSKQGPEPVDPRSRGLGWMDSPLVVAEHTKPAIAGGHSEGHWILDLCCQLPIRREGAWLSLGCGSGAQEMLVSERGLADRVLAYDRSETAVEAARTASAARGYQNLVFEVADPAAIDLPEKAFDVVLCTMVLHRIEEPTEFVARLQRALVPGGWLLANEYVGPAHFQFTDKQLRLVEELLAVFPDRLRWDYIEHRRKDTHLRRPLAFWLEEAPLEAISSERTEEVLCQIFEKVERRDYGGTLLNPLLEHIVGNFDPGREEDATLLRLVMYVERVLLREGSLPSDFAVFAGRKHE